MFVEMEVEGREREVGEGDRGGLAGGVDEKCF